MWLGRGARREAKVLVITQATGKAIWDAEGLAVCFVQAAGDYTSCQQVRVLLLLPLFTLRRSLLPSKPAARRTAPPDTLTAWLPLLLLVTVCKQQLAQLFALPLARGRHGAGFRHACTPHRCAATAGPPILGLNAVSRAAQACWPGVPHWCWFQLCWLSPALSCCAFSLSAEQLKHAGLAGLSPARLYTSAAGRGLPLCFVVPLFLLPLAGLLQLSYMACKPKAYKQHR